MKTLGTTILFILLTAFMGVYWHQMTTSYERDGFARWE